jgi:hypothetical protein
VKEEAWNTGTRMRRIFAVGDASLPGDLTTKNPEVKEEPWNTDETDFRGWRRFAPGGFNHKEPRDKKRTRRMDHLGTPNSFAFSSERSVPLQRRITLRGLCG